MNYVYNISGNQVIIPVRCYFLCGVAQFLPVRQPIQRFLLSLHDWLEEQESMTASLWLSKIEDLQVLFNSSLPYVTLPAGGGMAARAGIQC